MVEISGPGGRRKDLEDEDGGDSGGGDDAFSSDGSSTSTASSGGDVFSGGNNQPTVEGPGGQTSEAPSDRQDTQRDQGGDSGSSTDTNTDPGSSSSGAGASPQQTSPSGQTPTQNQTGGTADAGAGSSKTDAFTSTSRPGSATPTEPDYGSTGGVGDVDGVPTADSPGSDPAATSPSGGSSDIPGADPNAEPAAGPSQDEISERQESVIKGRIMLNNPEMFDTGPGDDTGELDSEDIVLSRNDQGDIEAEIRDSTQKEMVREQFVTELTSEGEADQLDSPGASVERTEAARQRETTREEIKKLFEKGEIGKEDVVVKETEDAFQASLSENVTKEILRQRIAERSAAVGEDGPFGRDDVVIQETEDGFRATVDPEVLEARDELSNRMAGARDESFSEESKFKRPGNFDIGQEDTSDGESQPQEQFGDIDWSFGLGDPEKDEVENFVDREGEEGSAFVAEYTKGVKEDARDRLAEPVNEPPSSSLYNPKSRLSAAAALEAANLVEGLPKVPGDVLEAVETVNYLQSNAFATGLAANKSDRQQAQRNIQKATGVAALAAGKGVTFARKNPQRAGAAAGLILGAEVAAERAALKGIRAASNVEVPSTSKTLDLRTPVQRARSRSPSIEVTNDPDAPAVSVDPAVKKQLVETIKPSSRSGSADLGRPLAMDLGEEPLSSRLPSNLPGTGNQGTPGMGRPLPPELGERGLSQRLVDRVSEDNDPMVYVDDQGRPFTERNPLGRPLRSQRGEEPFLSRISNALERGDRPTLFVDEDRAGAFVARNPVGRPLPLAMDETPLSSSLFNFFSGSGGRTDLGRPLPKDLGVPAISERLSLPSGGPGGLGRPLPNDIGEAGISTRLASLLSDDRETTIFIDENTGKPFVARNPLGRPLPTEFGGTGLLNLASENRLRDISIRITPGDGVSGSRDATELDADAFEAEGFDTDEIFDDQPDEDVFNPADNDVDVDADQGGDGNQQVASVMEMDSDDAAPRARDAPETGDVDDLSRPRTGPLAAGTAAFFTPQDALEDVDEDVALEGNPELFDVGPMFDQEEYLGPLDELTPEEDAESELDQPAPERVRDPLSEDTDTDIIFGFGTGSATDLEQNPEQKPEPEPEPDPDPKPEPFPFGLEEDQEDDFSGDGYNVDSETFDTGVVQSIDELQDESRESEGGFEYPDLSALDQDEEIFDGNVDDLFDV